MASPVCRTPASTAGAASAANLTINRPTGTVDGDILLAGISKDNTATVTAPSGWTEILSPEISNSYYSSVWWKRAASEPTSWTWTFTSIWRTGFAVAISGGVGSGTALDPDPTAAWVTAASTGSLTTNSITTATVDTLLAAIHTAVGFSPPWTPGSSMTEIVAFDEVHLQVLAQAASGATGGKSAGQGTTISPMKAVLLAVASVAAGAAASSYIPSSPTKKWLPFLVR